MIFKVYISGLTIVQDLQVKTTTISIKSAIPGLSFEAEIGQFKTVPENRRTRIFFGADTKGLLIDCEPLFYSYPTVGMHRGGELSWGEVDKLTLPPKNVLLS